jgi:hypothetical protein
VAFAKDYSQTLSKIRITWISEAGMRNTVAWLVVDAEHATVAEKYLSSFKPAPFLATTPQSQLTVLKVCRKPKSGF